MRLLKNYPEDSLKHLLNIKSKLCEIYEQEIYLKSDNKSIMEENIEVEITIGTCVPKESKVNF